MYKTLYSQGIVLLTSEQKLKDDSEAAFFGGQNLHHDNGCTEHWISNGKLATCFIIRPDCMFVTS